MRFVRDGITSHAVLVFWKMNLVDSLFGAMCRSEHAKVKLERYSSTKKFKQKDTVQNEE
jgi:hypothetical protein